MIKEEIHEERNDMDKRYYCLECICDEKYGSEVQRSTKEVLMGQDMNGTDNKGRKTKSETR